MEYHLTKKHLTGMRYALDTAAEQAVDIDLTLPDYCPDIERILSCSLVPRIYLSNVSGDRLSVEGGSCVRVLYLDGDGGGMHAYEYTQPFSESLPLKGTIGSCAVYTQAKPEYLNCRAMSPRKLSLHGAFSLCVKIAEPCELDYFTYDDGGDLQLRTEKTAASSMCGMCSESFSVREDIPLNAKSGVSSLLSYRLGAQITEIKAIEHKIMLSAELRLELMYLCGVDKPDTECMSYSLPVSRVIDCEGVSDDAVIDGDLSVLSFEARLSDDALDASPLLSLDAKLCFNAQCWKEQEIEILSDTFSTERDVEIREESFSCRSGIVCLTCGDLANANADVDEEIGRVIDVHCEKLSASASLSGGSADIRTKLCAGILYENADGEVRYVERDAELSYRYDIGGCDELLRLCAVPDSLSYRLTDSSHLELRVRMSYRMTLCRRTSCTAITSVSADDDAPAKAKNSALILYYPDDGERIWDIGKRFCSRPAAIIEENGLEGDSVDSGMMLMIPTA